MLQGIWPVSAPNLMRSLRGVGLLPSVVVMVCFVVAMLPSVLLVLPSVAATVMWFAGPATRLAI